MARKSKSEKEEPFNWKGIRDNKDGSFDVSDKWARSRLQKEFRKQGIRTRSKRTGDKGFVVYPVGQRKQRISSRGRLSRKELQHYPGYKPKTRFREEGPRPQLQQGRPGFTPHPSYGAPPITRSSRKRKYPISEAVMKSAEKRAQKNMEAQRSPYLPDGTPRPGYQTYIDKTGTKRIVRMPTGGWKDRFASKQQKEMQHQARVQESHKTESEMAERSKAQPSTRVPEHQQRGQLKPEKNIMSPTAEEDLQRKRREFLKRGPETPPTY